MLLLLILQSQLMLAQDNNVIKLPAPNLDRGLTVLKALSARISIREYDIKALELQDLGELLWTANGVNRTESGKRTAPSAMNSQDIDVYALLPSGAYMYNAAKHQLELISTGDYRSLAAGRQEFVKQAPVVLLLVSDISRFKNGNDSLKLSWAAMDAGYVSQNIGLYCASVGLATVPRASMDAKKLKEALLLKQTQHILLNNPVGYKKGE